MPTINSTASIPSTTIAPESRSQVSNPGNLQKGTVANPNVSQQAGGIFARLGEYADSLFARKVKEAPVRVLNQKEMYQQMLEGIVAGKVNLKPVPVVGAFNALAKNDISAMPKLADHEIGLLFDKLVNSGQMTDFWIGNQLVGDSAQSYLLGLDAKAHAEQLAPIAGLLTLFARMRLDGYRSRESQEIHNLRAQIKDLRGMLVTSSPVNPKKLTATIFIQGKDETAKNERINSKISELKIQIEGLKAGVKDTIDFKLALQWLNQILTVAENAPVDVRIMEMWKTMLNKNCEAMDAAGVFADSELKTMNARYKALTA